MNKLFRPKCMRRMAVFMALVAPIVYLFGSLFFALNGAHGQEVLAEPVYVDSYVEVDGAADNRFRFTFGSQDECKLFMVNSSNFYYSGVFNYGGAEFDHIRYVVSGNSSYLEFSSSVVMAAYSNVSGNLVVGSAGLTFECVSTSSYLGLSSLFAPYGTVEAFTSVPSSEVPENSGAYSDYLFKNFFAKDNFLQEWGENAISENPYGFAPFGYFWRYLDNNFLHLSNEQVGLMGYGYMYYAAHVLLFDVGFILVTFFINVIQKVTDKIGGGDL